MALTTDSRTSGGNSSWEACAANSNIFVTSVKQKDIKEFFFLMLKKRIGCIE
jgi:hypothetical protein